MKAVLPDRFVQHLRATVANESESDPAADEERAALAEFVARWSLSDLYYRNEELDKALDLIAICSMGNSASHLAASNHS